MKMNLQTNMETYHEAVKSIVSSYATLEGEAICNSLKELDEETRMMILFEALTSGQYNVSNIVSSFSCNV